MSPRITPRPLTLPQQRGRETRARIVGAAARAFARRGYQATTVDEIAIEAGISMGTLYHHFASKEALFRGILGDNVNRGLHELGSEMAAASTFRAALEKFVSYFCGQFEARGELSGLSVEFWALAAREPWAADVIGQSIRGGIGLITQSLAAAREAGFVREDLDLDSAATLLLATIEGIGVLVAVAPDLITVRTCARSWADLIERFIVDNGGKGDINEFQRRMAAVVAQGTDATTAAMGQDG